MTDNKLPENLVGVGIIKVAVTLCLLFTVTACSVEKHEPSATPQIAEASTPQPTVAGTGMDAVPQVDEGFTECLTVLLYLSQYHQHRTRLEVSVNASAVNSAFNNYGFSYIDRLYGSGYGNSLAANVEGEDVVTDLRNDYCLPYIDRELHTELTGN